MERSSEKISDLRSQVDCGWVWGSRVKGRDERQGTAPLTQLPPHRRCCMLFTQKATLDISRCCHTWSGGFPRPDSDGTGQQHVSAHAGTEEGNPEGWGKENPRPLDSRDP